MAPKIAVLRCRVEVNWVALKFAIQMRLYWNCCENNLFSVHLVRSIHTIHLEAYGRMFSVFGHPFDCCRRCCFATIFPWDQQVPDYLNIYSVFPPNSERHGKWQQHRSLSLKKKIWILCCPETENKIICESVSSLRIKVRGLWATIFFWLLASNFHDIVFYEILLTAL